MADIIKRTRKEWLIYHYNQWLRTLTGAEANLMVLENEGIEMKNALNYSKAVSEVKGNIVEAEKYIKVLEELLTKENK